MKVDWKSSYEEHNYGDIFYALMRVYQPESVVELGTKAGYSAYHMARGLRENNKGALDCYDLWENYPFNSVPESEVTFNLKEFSDIVKLHNTNALDISKLHESIDVLHVDLSNDGALLNSVLPAWIPKVTQLIIIEGGSPERDSVDWMRKYNKEPIAPWLKTFCSEHKLEYVTIDPFPSISLIKIP